MRRARERERERERERADTDLELPFSFSLVILTHAFSPLPSSQIYGGSETFSQSSPKMGAKYFLLPYIVAAMFQLLLFRFSIPFLSTNQNPSPICCWCISIFNPGICCYSGLDFGDHTPFTIPFVYRFSFFFSLSFSLSLSLCLSIFVCLGSLSRICSPFPPSRIWPKILPGNNSQSIVILNNFIL